MVGKLVFLLVLVSKKRRWEIFFKGRYQVFLINLGTSKVDPMDCMQTLREQSSVVTNISNRANVRGIISDAGLVGKKEFDGVYGIFFLNNDKY